MDPFAAVAGAAVTIAALVTLFAAKQVTRARRVEGELGRLRRELAAERHAAGHDHLTGLTNRRGFYTAATALVREAARRPLLAVLVDLDDFKRVNDTFGHRAGDDVLVNVAHRLAAFAAGGLVARLGGDEFAVLLHQPWQRRDRCEGHNDRLAESARRLTEVLSAPVSVVGGWKIAVRASIGVVTVSADSELDDVLERADAAMYKAKTARTPSLPGGPSDRRRTSDPDGWFAGDAQRRQVRAVAGDAVTWSSG